MRIACLLDDGFQGSEYLYTCEAFRQAGHEVIVVGFEAGRELEGHGRQVSVSTDQALDQARPKDFDALLVVGDQAPDRLHIHPAAVSFTRAFFDFGMPVFDIGRSPQLLIMVGVVKPAGLGKEAAERETVWPTVTDAIQAGRADVDREVVVDRNLVTTSKPEAIQAFVRGSLAMLEQYRRSTA
jgi:protease I